ncbi:MAG: AarF/ABC1/UbiB kinase family protein [Archangiaceae bacterium]|nr:AarF/ABC1/UbiB kinase family protein [Archangiaceae bacterium]
MSRDDSIPPSGRFTRFRKLATLSAKLSADAVGSGLKRLTGAKTDGLGLPSAERIVEALGEMKGMAMKLGQALSMDPGAFPPEARAVLARLQNQAQPMAYETVARVVTEQLGAPPEEKFARFEQTPLASASLGQVHRATTLGGLEVVVKVQYPGIETAIESDLDNLGTLVKALGVAGKRLDVRKHFEEVRADFLAETDYRNEARNAEAFAAALGRTDELCVPRPLLELTAQRVLTLELLQGPTLKELLVGPLDEAERFRLGRLLIVATFAPFFAGGLMHVDPHPGNYLRLPDGRLGVLDFGNVKRFTPEFVETNHEMLHWLLHEGRHIDVVALLKRVGFKAELPDAEVAELIFDYANIMARPMRAPTWDYTQDDTRERMRSLAISKATKFMRLKPPEQSPLYFRSIGGLWLNLRALEVKGPMRDVFLELERDADARRVQVR